jgi:hypothetical protein
MLMDFTRLTGTLISRIVCVMGIAAGLSLCGAASAAPAKDQLETAPVPFLDGVSDSNRGTAFVSSPKGGIQAICLEDGKVLWTNDEGQAEPWLVAGDRLIVRGERIVVLDLKNEGKRVRQCDTPAFPKVEVPDRCTVSFNLWHPRVSGNTLEARWYAVAQIDRSKGRPFAFQAWTAFNKAAPAGTLKVDLESGKVEVQANAKPTDVTAGLVPPDAKPDRVPADLPEKLVPVWEEYVKDQNGRIALLDGRLVGVAMKLEKMGAEYSKQILLNTWDTKTGTAGESVELVKDKALAIANAALTADRRHAGVTFSTSAVTLYSLSTGKPVARDVKGVASPEHAFVDGKRLYHVAQTAKSGEQVLRAIDLENGKATWERTIKPRNTVPLPPGANAGNG